MPAADPEATKAALATLLKGFLDQHNAKAALPFLERAAKLENGTPHGQAMLVEAYAGALRYAANVGIGYDEVVALLEKEGVEKFEAAWSELTESLRGELDAK